MECVCTILDERSVLATWNDGRPPLGALEMDDKEHIMATQERH